VSFLGATLGHSVEVGKDSRDLNELNVKVPTPQIKIQSGDLYSGIFLVMVAGRDSLRIVHSVRISISLLSLSVSSQRSWSRF
jgi:hypothetical protein